MINGLIVDSRKSEKFIVFIKINSVINLKGTRFARWHQGKLANDTLLTFIMAEKYPSGEEKRRLQEQLKDVEFVTNQKELPQFKCDFCKKIALEKHVVICGHEFCNKCNDDVYGRACPMNNCDNKLIQSSTRNRDFEVAVYSLEVYCRNRRLGCNVKIPLLSYLEHEKNCPVAVEMAEASDKVIKSMRAEIDDLKHIVKNLQSNLTTAEENIKMNLYEERALKTDLQLMEGKLNDIISKKITTEGLKTVDKFDKEFKRIATEQSTLRALVDNNFDILRNEELGMEKKDIEKYIKDKVDEKCNKGMQEFAKNVTQSINDIAGKQKEELTTTISNDLIGKLSITEIDLDIKMKNEFDEKFKLFRQNIESKMDAKFNQETAANKIVFERWSTETLNNKVQSLKKDFEKNFTLFLNQKFQICKQELSDVMLEDVNDKLDECKHGLIKYIKKELEVKIALQKQFLLNKVLQEIQIKSENYKTEVLGHVTKKMLADLATQKEDMETNFLIYINDNMRATENEFCTYFSDQINVQMDEQFQALHSILSEEFNNEITLMQGHIQEQYETGVKLEENIKTLDTNYLGKTEFLLEKYSTTFVWPISDFLEKVKMLQSGTIIEIESDSFMVKECKMLMKAKLTWRNVNAILMLAFLPSDQQRPIYYHRRTVWLLDQNIAVDEPKHRIRVEEPHFGSETALEWMNGFCALGIKLFPSLEEIARSHFLKDGAVIIKILIEPLAILYKSMVSNNGILVWKIENVSKLIQDEKYGVIERVSSPYFYSSPNSYRMQLEVYLATPFVGLYLQFFRGQFDAFLPATFAHRTIFMILDQSDLTEKKKKHLISTPNKISRNTCDDFVTKFALRADILNNSVPQAVFDPPPPIYLKDDAILIKVIVAPVADCSDVNEQ